MPEAAREGVAAQAAENLANLKKDALVEAAGEAIRPWLAPGLAADAR